MKQSNSEFTEDAFKHKDCSYQLKEGEHFVGNHAISESKGIPDYLSGLKTARLGEQAYDLNGVPLERSYYRPLIVHKSDYEQYNNIMESRLKAIRRS